MRRTLAILSLFALAGCALPQWRVFQKQIDPKLGEKSPQQVEAERQGASYLMQKSAVVEPDPANQIQQIHAVATPLSQSLGEPKKPVTIEDKDAVIKELRKGLLNAQKKDEQWQAFARKYAYSELEGTGYNLAGPAGIIGLAAIAAACIFIPGFLTFLLFVIRRMRSGIQQMAQAVEEYQIENPKAAAELKEHLSSTMDTAAKKLVKREKNYLDESNLAELRLKVASQSSIPQPATP